MHSDDIISLLELHFPIPYLPMAEDHLSFSLPIFALKSQFYQQEIVGTGDVYECTLTVEGVCHCWSIGTDNCNIPVVCLRDYHGHNPVTH